MKSYKIKPISSSEITPPGLFYARRKFMQMAGGATLAALMPSTVWANEKLSASHNATYNLKDELTPYKDVTTYNNFYEFGTSKEDPANNAKGLKTRPLYLKTPASWVPINQSDLS